MEEEIWKECVFNDISPSHALVTGAKLLLGSSNEEKILKKKVKNLQIQLDFYNQKLSEIQKIKAEQKLTEEKRREIAINKQKFMQDHKKSFEAAAKILARENYSFGSVYGHWNKLNAEYKREFGEFFQQADFIQICREMNNAPKQP